jgi:hypothetical protein
LNDGRVINRYIESALGNVENPLSNEQLDAKFLDLTEDILPRSKSKFLLENCWNMGSIASAGNFAK